MIEVLHKVEQNITKLIKESELNTMFIDYHDPFVNRIWFQYNQYRVYLHKIFPSKSSKTALFHPHPWKSAIRILKTGYEMGIGHSETKDVPSIDCRIWLPVGSSYEMLDKNGWHYVNPKEPSYSLMVTGEIFLNESPVLQTKKFRNLTEEETNDILSVVDDYYYVGF